jgi:hypothetical protein
VLLSRFAAWIRSPRARPPAAGSRRAPFRDAGGGDLSHPPSRAGEASVLLLLLYDSRPTKFLGMFSAAPAVFDFGDVRLLSFFPAEMVLESRGASLIYFLVASRDLSLAWGRGKML